MQRAGGTEQAFAKLITRIITGSLLLDALSVIQRILRSVAKVSDFAKIGPEKQKLKSHSHSKNRICSTTIHEFSLP